MNAGLALQPANVGNNLINLFLREAFNPGHIPEIPVVGRHALPDGPMKAEISMVAGLINPMNQWRSLPGARRARTMTTRAAGVEERFPRRVFRRSGGCRTRRLFPGPGLLLFLASRQGQTAGRQQRHDQDHPAENAISHKLFILKSK